MLKREKLQWRPFPADDLKPCTSDFSSSSSCYNNNNIFDEEASHFPSIYSLKCGPHRLLFINFPTQIYWCFCLVGSEVYFPSYHTATLDGVTTKSFHVSKNKHKLSVSQPLCRRVVVTLIKNFCIAAAA